MVDAVGIEPTTYRLYADCSTNWAIRPIWGDIRVTIPHKQFHKLLCYHYINITITISRIVGALCRNRTYYVFYHIRFADGWLPIRHQQRFKMVAGWDLHWQHDVLQKFGGSDRIWTYKFSQWQSIYSRSPSPVWIHYHYPQSVMLWGKLPKMDSHHHKLVNSQPCYFDTTREYYY